MWMLLLLLLLLLMLLLLLLLLLLLHGLVMRMVACGRFMESGRMGCSVMERAPVMMMRGRCVITMLLLTLVARMRLGCRIVDIVVPYSVVARQRASDAWVPPERTALDGRRTM
ncbi:hypothetical protein LY76DRAFT_602515 [Colletotrichum caudatum]|nr:hypothetical protein LY76DRAFT_602515 [Colletotrichum caudatum]